MATVRVFSHILNKRYAIVSGVPNISALSCSSIKFGARHGPNYSTKKSVTQVDDTENKVQVGVAEVVKENAKSAVYLSIIIGGIGITAAMLYAIFRELFSNKSPNGVYSKALDDCMKDPKVLDALGAPIKAYGEENRRGRRNHVSHGYYTKDGVQHMRMQFYIQGIRRRGTVYLEVRENEKGDYEYTYLYVKVDDIMKTVIRLHDSKGQEKDYKTYEQPSFI